MLRQLDCAAFYLAVRSRLIAAVGAELNRRLRNAGVPDVVAKSPSIARRCLFRYETPFANIDLNVRPADVPAAVTVCGPSRTVFSETDPPPGRAFPICAGTACSV